MILKAVRISAVKGYVSQKMILKAVKISSGQDPLLKQSEIIAEKITAIITEIITGIKNVVIKNVVKKREC